jgi:Ca2+/Na+ antiporter
MRRIAPGNISVGNSVGSNIFNLGFILGGCRGVHGLSPH